MTYRLTNGDREVIANNAVTAAFTEREKAFKVNEARLAKLAYDSLITPEEQKLVKKLPTNWYRLDKCLRYNVGGYTVELCVDAPGLPVPYQPKGSTRGSYSCQNQGTIEFGPLCEEIQKFAEDKETLKDERSKAYRSTMALLGTVNSVGKLREIWPEGAPFYQHLELERPASVPAIRVEEVNAALGLVAA